MPKKGVWLRENGTETQAQVGVFNGDLPGRSNKMVPCMDGFLTVGVPAIQRCREQEWATIDEVGYLETECGAYCDAIRSLMEKTHVAAVVRKQDTPFLQELIHRTDVFLVDLDAPYGNLGCVIMASGLGKRFGGNKLMAEFDGAPMICRALDATEGIFSKRVVVTRHKDVAELCRGKGIAAVLHDLPYRSDTVRLGLDAVGDVQGCMFCPGDQPLLQQDTVAALALAAVNDPETIWRAVFEDTPGAPVVFPRWAFPELSALPDGKGGGYVVRRHPEALRMVCARSPWELMDVDHPETLAELERQCRRRQ